jgi:nitrogenase-associated protein
MATITFYEKVGCASNSKQKRLLAEAGHQVIAKNLLTESWQADDLRLFFGDLPVVDWFNANAPAVKYGEIEPETLSEAEALALMVETPLLIRRPLMQVGNERRVGFDAEKVNVWLGVAVGNSVSERCSHSDGSSCRHD